MVVVGRPENGRAEACLKNERRSPPLYRRKWKLKNLGDRIDIDTVRALCNTLVQADTFGTSIAKTLRVYADTLRTQRRQQAEEQAAKTTVKLVFPLVFFIFPSIFLVALGPSAISLWEGMEKYLLNQ